MPSKPPKPPPIQRDPNGIPILTASGLEEIAEHFLRVTAPGTLMEPTFTPLASIVAKLRDQGLLHFSGHEDLGQAADGRNILGCYDTKEKRISIDRSLSDDDPRFPFTLAHELGHFYLHSRVRAEAIPQIIVDTLADIVLNRVDSSKPRTLMEWQANRFAAGILLPQSTVLDAVCDAQRSLGVTRNIGEIWIDGQRGNARDHKAIIQQLASLYRTSRAVARIRLQELGILRYRHSGKAAVDLGSLMGKALTMLFEHRPDE